MLKFLSAGIVQGCYARFLVGLFFFECMKIYFRQRKTKEATRSVINATTQCEK